MASASDIPRFTVEQYLALERRADCKHEYHDGYLIAMAGAIRAHNQIAGNVYRKIGDRFADRDCTVYISDMRVRVTPSGPYTYPDLVAVCGEARFQDDEMDTLLNPTTIVEVLSDSSESYDRGAKFAQYRRLPSLQEYVIIAQDKVLVERYTLQGEEWLLTDFRSLDESLRLATIDCEIPLGEIYAKVKLPADEGAET